uniref:Dienelactone hydrolase domain-containing protein n=1 Tax=Globisporangium ultimum (strain ATCC 200006 / CBS 805.95 / DAOM BR144) TaxID=431595 RepID=K3WXS2_GLOUD
MSCCPVNSEPPLASADATAGATRTFGHTTFYTAGPPTARAGILAFPDIFGPNSGRSKQDADNLGKLGYAVVLVDLTDGDWFDGASRERMPEWTAKYTYEEYLSARIDDAITYLKTVANVEHIASYGYCFGAWVGARLSVLDEPVLRGHVSFHPSWSRENSINGDGAVERLSERIKVPQLLLSASNDPDFVKANGSVHKILSSNAAIAALSDVVDFPDVNHGWVNRGDLENSKVKAAVAKAWHAAVKFFQTVCPV